MVTKVDKALVALIVPLIMYFVSQYMPDMPAEARTGLEVFLLYALPFVGVVLTGFFVWLVPNKKS